MRTAEDDCPRCGWHGYFHHYLATIDGDRASAVCDNCHADLRPDITVTVKFLLRPLRPGCAVRRDPPADSRAEAERITARLAASHWPPDAAQLPWVASAYPP